MPVTNSKCSVCQVEHFTLATRSPYCRRCRAARHKEVRRRSRSKLRSGPQTCRVCDREYPSGTGVRGGPFCSERCRAARKEARRLAGLKKWAAHGAAVVADRRATT